MVRGILAGSALPVAVVSGGDLAVGEGIEAGTTVIPVRSTIAEVSALTNGSVTPTVDKRGYSCVGFYIPGNYTGATKVRAQVSYNASNWFYARLNDAYLEEALVAGVGIAVAFYDMLAYPYVRLVFLNASDVQQVQTNLGVKYSLVV